MEKALTCKRWKDCAVASGAYSRSNSCDTHSGSLPCISVHVTDFVPQQLLSKGSDKKRNPKTLVCVLNPPIELGPIKDSDC